MLLWPQWSAYMGSLGTAAGKARQSGVADSTLGSLAKAAAMVGDVRRAVGFQVEDSLDAESGRPSSLFGG